MKNKRIFRVCMTILCIIAISLTGAYSSYAATDFMSNGRLEYTNQTPNDPTDDVIFDAKDLMVLDTAINVLDTRIKTLSGKVDNGIGRIVDELNRYPGINLEQKGPDGMGNNPSLEEIAQAISGITNIPADTYFYEDGTEGDSNIVRYKKIDGKYYPCDEHGTVAEGATEVDVSQKTLVDYSAAVSTNISAGSAAFADGNLHLGDGSDNAAYYEQGSVSARTGTATAPDVLTGKTFTSAAGINVTGTMVNHGSWTNTPTESGKVTIPAGYHNGSGYVDVSSVYQKGFENGSKDYNAIVQNASIGYQKLSASLNNTTEIIFTADRDYVAICDFGFSIWSTLGELVCKTEIYDKNGSLKQVLDNQSTKKQAPHNFQTKVNLKQGDTIRVWGIPYVYYSDVPNSIGANLTIALLYFN